MQYSGAGLITNEFVQKFIFSDVFTFLKSDLRLLRGIFSQKKSLNGMYKFFQPSLQFFHLIHSDKRYASAKSVGIFAAGNGK